MVSLGAISFTGHVLPVLATVLVWFLATGLVAWLDNRARHTFARSLLLAGVAAIGGIAIIAATMHSATLWGVYASLAGAILVWAWHEISFLTGVITGPRREACPPGARGWQRFTHAVAVVAWHEVALALSAAGLIWMSQGAPNQVGAMAFALLLAMRLSTKIAIFLGVPNMSADILPQHLAYLKSYFGKPRLGPELYAAIAACLALAAWLATIALAAPAGSADAAGASLLFALAALGALEHLFLALPLRDGALWGWALPVRTPATRRHPAN
ncbi:putative photosynthetic complex assembly protein PuhE [Sphingomonas sp. R3G8C]|uniref:putative photosynthetic complex assembly protein PuhE n=1 Tax=Novosphingobium rhizosphaerae TaxID=1551649 RepID=UPI0015CABE31